MTFNAQRFIEESRKKGVPDSVTFEYLNKKGLIPKDKLVTTQITPTPEKTTAQKVGSFLGIEKFGQGIGQTISNLTGGTKKLEQAQENQLALQTALLEKIKQRKSEGADVSRLENALKDLGGDISKQSETLTDAGTGGLTNREFVGSALGTAALFAPGAAKGASLATKVGVGATTGYAFDVANKLQDKEKELTEAFTPGIGTVVGGGLPILGKITGLGQPGKTSQKLANKLEEVNLRLTPTDKQNIARKGSDVVEYLSKKKIVGSPNQRLAKINTLYDDMEKQVTSVLKKSARSFNKTDVINSIKDIPELYIDDVAEYSKVQRQVASVIKTIQEKFPDNIPAERLNSVKRKLFKAAYNKQNTQVANDALNSIGEGIYGLLDKSIKELKPLNREYSTIILARKLLTKAQSRAQIGIVGKAIGSVVGATVGGAVGGPVGSAAGTIVGPAVGQVVAGTAPRSAVGAGLQSIANVVDKIPTDKAGNLQLTKKALIQLLNSITSSR